jgi:hypothetical protein
MNLLNHDADFDKNIPLALYCDSDNAITIVIQGKLSPKVLWISLRYYLVRDLIKKNLIALVKIASKENLADILTKAKPYRVFEADRENLLHMRASLMTND